jgi:hypothetical protein
MRKFNLEYGDVFLLKNTTWCIVLEDGIYEICDDTDNITKKMIDRYIHEDISLRQLQTFINSL